MDPIKLARELEAMAQTGLHFSTDHFDRERYGRLREIAAENGTNGDTQGYEGEARDPGFQRHA